MDSVEETREGLVADLSVEAKVTSTADDQLISSSSSEQEIQDAPAKTQNDLPEQIKLSSAEKEEQLLESVTEATKNLEISTSENATAACANSESADDKQSSEPSASKSNSETENIRAVISKYLSMAMKEKETKKTSILLKDKYVTDFLVLSLMNESPKVLIAAMEVFEILISSRRNHSALQSLPYFMPMLEKISKGSKLPSETRQDAIQMMKLLKETKQALGARNGEDNTASGQNTSKLPMGKPNNATTLTRRKQPTGREAIFVLRPGVLQMHYNRTNIEQNLIRVPGIISLTYNLAKNHCIVRGKRHVASEVFGVAIANLGFEVSLLTKNETLEEILIPITPDLKELSSKENLPGYLPEDYEELQGPIADNAVCSKDLTDKNKDGSLFTSAMSFVKNSFYW